MLRVAALKRLAKSGRILHRAGVNVLVIDDDDEQCELYKRQIRSHFRRFDVACMCASNLDAGYAICSEMEFSLVLLDASLEQSAPHETVKRENIMRFGYPVIVMSGVDDTTLMDEALANGACDFIIKGVTSYVAQMEKIAIVLKHSNPEITVGPLITRSRSKPSKVRRWIAENGLGLAAVVISIFTVSGGLLSNAWGVTKGRWLSDVTINQSMTEHDRRITANATEIATIKTTRATDEQKAEDRHAEILRALGKLAETDAASKQQREDIERSLRELREDLRARR